MGTEIPQLIALWINRFADCCVKLNNPLMGTETP